MKLAEALALRADIQKEVASLKARIIENAQTKEGGKPSEDPHMLLERVCVIAEELQKLIQRINRTNSNTEIEPGMSLADALAVRETLKIKHDAYNSLGNAATISYGHYHPTEMILKLEGTVEVSDIRKKASEIARDFRKIDMQIQEKNWGVDLIE